MKVARRRINIQKNSDRNDKYVSKLIHYLHNPIIHLFYPQKILHNHCLQVLLGHEDVLREIKNNAYANFFFFGGGGGLKRCIMGFVQVVNG